MFEVTLGSVHEGSPEGLGTQPVLSQWDRRYTLRFRVKLPSIHEHLRQAEARWRGRYRRSRDSGSILNAITRKIWPAWLGSNQQIRQDNSNLTSANVSGIFLTPMHSWLRTLIVWNPSLTEIGDSRKQGRHTLGNSPYRPQCEDRNMHGEAQWVSVVVAAPFEIRWTKSRRTDRVRDGVAEVCAPDNS